jgi:protein gp37
MEKIKEQKQKIKDSRIIFVNSMSDLFHKDIPLEFIQRVFKTMNECPQHIFQVLTKRAERLEELSSQLNWTDNIWLGVTVENESVQYRINHLRKTKAKIKFLSLEPLLSPLPNLNFKKIDWVIVGGESGRKARKIEKEWVEDIRIQCEKASLHSNVPINAESSTGALERGERRDEKRGERKIAFFFKQWGGMNNKANGRELNGKTYSEMPRVA